jgi:ubiquinone/menaquinone biosynthesis C-methylase UbiE
MQEHADPVGMPAFKRLELDGWQEQAATYDGHVGRLTQEADKHLIETVGLKPGMRLLDICSGPGYGAGLAAERGAKACGIDFAPAMVEQAKRRFPAVEFRFGDAEALDFPDASFDAAICPFGLMHLNDPDRAIGEAFRVLKPGARYGFAAWSVPVKAELLGLALKVLAVEADMGVPMPPGPPFFQYSDPAFAKAALERAGFDSVAFREVPLMFRGRTPEDVWDFFMKGTVRIMVLIRLQTSERQARIRAGILEAAKKYQKGGELQIPSSAIVHSGRKPPKA